MPLFTASSPYDADVERATSELNAEENILLFREIADKIRHAPSPSAKDCLRSIVKRINDKNPHVALQALSLLDTCVQRSGYAFHLEMATADFISECRTLIGSGKPHSKVVKKLKMLIKRWAENEFKTDKSLSQVVSLYTSMKNEGHKFNFDDINAPVSTHSSSSHSTSDVSRQEQDDIAKAIALSLKDSHQPHGAGSGTSSLYPTASAGNFSSSSSNAGPREPRKVRALYDFEAAEDNELTFKAGEIIGVLDDSDVNWWKGVSWRGEGLFPANFVTADLTVEPESEHYKPRKSVHFHDEVEVKVVERSVPVLEIDEVKIDDTLGMMQNSDPTDPESDSPELIHLEEQCKEMGPLIDQELVKIDKEHNSLMESNTKLMEAFQMYHSLMRELPSYGYVSSINSTLPQQTVYGGGMSVAGGQPSLAGYSTNHTLPHAGSYGALPHNNSSENVSVYHNPNQNFVSSHQNTNTPTPPPILQQQQQAVSYSSQQQQQYVGGAYGAAAAMSDAPNEGYAQTSSETIQSINYTSSAQQPITAQSLL